MRWLTGVIGASVRVSAWTGSAIDIQEAESGGVQPVAEDPGDALREIETELGIVLTLAAEADGVEDHRVHIVECVSVEMPPVGREQPGPSEDVAGVERVEGLHASPRRRDSESNPAAPQRPERVGVSALSDDRGARGDDDVSTASGQHVEMFRVHPREEAMCRQFIGDAVQLAVAVRAPSVDRIAAASSVMSMPTGHQAMHRPQPTQPEVPN